jgi:molybdopterin-guanine dinucleotide biosynthesis protein A
MGRPKALLQVPPTAKPLLAHMVDRLLPLQPARLLVVSNDDALPAQVGALPLHTTFVADLWPDTGTLGGIATALAHMYDQEGWALVLATDLPLISAPLCAHLLEIAAQAAAGGEAWACVVPIVGGYEEPLHALYHRRCLPAIKERLSRGERRVISFMPDVPTRRVSEAELRTVDPTLRSFVNANTPGEWEVALAMLAAERGEFRDAAADPSDNHPTTH